MTAVNLPANDGRVYPGRERRRFLVRGGHRVEMEVKRVLEGRVYIACDDAPIGGTPDMIRKGAVLVYHMDETLQTEPRFDAFDGGIYDAILSMGYHIGDSYDDEIGDLEIALGSWGWAMQQCWQLNRDSSQAEIDAYREAVQLGRKRTAHARGREKSVADLAAAHASNHRDRKGRVNFASRPLLLWKADQRVRERVAVTREIRPRIDLRRWALVSVLDRAWELIDSGSRTINSVLDLYRPDKAHLLRPPRIEKIASELSDVAKSFGYMSLAPFSRRALPRIVEELRISIERLRDGDIAGAHDPLDRSARSLMMTRARRILEEARVQANRFRDVEDPQQLRGGDRQGLVTTIGFAERLLIVGGRPIDHDFEHPVIEEKVAGPLMRARGAATSVAKFRGSTVYQMLKEAAAPL